MSTSLGLVRWTLKKTSRSAIAHSSRLIKGALAGGGDTSALAVRALTYHRFGDIPRDPFCLRARDFAAQMRYIARAELAISLAQVHHYLNGTQRLPPNAVLVTVDDGFRSLLRAALPILHEYAIPAVAFVSAGLIGSQRSDARFEPPPEDYLDWSELERLAKSGVNIQSHGWAHLSLARLRPEQAREELARSKQLLEDRLGTRVTAFAYPFGTRADFNGEVARMVEQTGYRLAFTSRHGAIRPADNAFVLSRIKVESGEKLNTFASLVHGGLDAWHWIDRGLWRLQSSRAIKR